MGTSDIFVVPIADKVLIYAPLQDFSALVNRAAAEALRNAIISGQTVAAAMAPVLSALREAPLPRPQKRSGPLREPLFLGILPTRGCNMGCRYCDFLASDHQVMPLETAKNAVDAYLNLLSDQAIDHGAIHFFGGEPFYAPDVVAFTVEYARLAGKRRKIDLHFEVVTNGLYSKTIAEWIAQNIDSVVLSFDGMPEAQNILRPHRNGTPSFETVFNNARIFSQGSCELVIRSCVSQANIDTLMDWADFILKNLIPVAVCLEPMIETTVARANQLSPVESMKFVRNFLEAADLLTQHGIPAVYSTAEIHALKGSVCPLGQDALIVTPEGAVNACYQIEQQWLSAGLDYRLGTVSADGFQIPAERVAAIRENHVDGKSLCTGCFCRYHCAGGCPIVHSTDLAAGSYDEYCVQTRMITAATLLTELGQRELRDRWLADDNSFAAIAISVDDRIIADAEMRAG